MNEMPETTPDPISLAKGYEVRDVSIRTIVEFMLGLGVIAIIAHVGIWYLAKADLRSPRPEDDTPSLAPQTGQFPDPNLEPSITHHHTPWDDLAKLRFEEQAVFEQLGWQVDPVTGKPHVPDGVLAELAKRPVAKATTYPTTHSTGSTESKGGAGQ